MSMWGVYVYVCVVAEPLPPTPCRCWSVAVVVTYLNGHLAKLHLRKVILFLYKIKGLKPILFH